MRKEEQRYQALKVHAEEKLDRYHAWVCSHGPLSSPCQGRPGAPMAPLTLAWEGRIFCAFFQYDS